MALKKSKALENGVTGDYWRIKEVNIVYPSNVQVTMGLYLNSEARKSGKHPLIQESYSLNISGEPTRALVYEALKSLIVEIGTEEGMTTQPGFFADAENV